MTALKAPKVTTDDLAIMIAKGFEEVHTKFRRVDERFDRLETRFDALEKTVRGEHGARLKRIERKLQIV